MRPSQLRQSYIEISRFFQQRSFSPRQRHSGILTAQRLYTTSEPRKLKHKHLSPVKPRPGLLLNDEGDASIAEVAGAPQVSAESEEAEEAETLEEGTPSFGDDETPHLQLFRDYFKLSRQ